MFLHCRTTYFLSKPNHEPPPTGDAYVPPWWLWGGHSETIWAASGVPLPSPQYHREYWDTPDGDFIVADWLAHKQQAPLLILFHGLEGSSSSHYARMLMSAAENAGWNACVPHFRTCGGKMNRRPRAYHSGDTAEIEWIIEEAQNRLVGYSPSVIYAIGVSLGGNALLKCLGERPQSHALRNLRGAISISAPLDLKSAGMSLEKGANRWYSKMFLSSLLPKAKHISKTWSGLLDPERLKNIQTIREFDDCVTAPLHGFADVYDYWETASAKPWLQYITHDVLIIHAENDPFVPAYSLPTPAELSSKIQLCVTPRGGHVGFVSGTYPPGNLHWLGKKMLHFFQSLP